MQFANIMFQVIIMKIYVTQAGDSLYSIGKKYGVTIEQLINANGSTVTPTLIIGQAIIIPTAFDERPKKIINGYAYPVIERTALQSALPYLSNISPFSYGVKADGSLVMLNDADMIAIAGGSGVKPILIITTLTEEGIFNSQRSADVLQNDDFADTLIQNILNQLEKYDYFGVDIDFEYIPTELRENYAAFIAKLKSKIAPLGYKTFVSVAPKTSAAQRGLLYEAHDYALLGNAADFILVMTYEWGYTYGPPLAIAPLDKVEEVLRYAVSEIDPAKILIGIPNYAYDWTLPFVSGSRAESMSNTEAVNRARRVGANIMFNEKSKTPYYNYYKDGKEHIVWFEDARSINARMELVNELSLAGMSIWNIMDFYKPLYTTINNYFLPDK